MAFAYWFGNFLLGLGPGVVIFSFYVGPKPFLVLLSLASAFYWLLSLFIIAAIFRGFVPLDPSPGPYAALVLTAVVVQEGWRVLLHFGHRKMVAALDTLAQRTQARLLTDSDHQELALSHGMGHGFAHSVFFFVSFLQLAVGDGTYYSSTCPSMSIFVVLALSSLAFLLLHSFSMLVCFEGLRRGNWVQAAVAPALHTAAALVTLGSFAHNGCLVVVPVNLAIALVPTGLAARLAFQRLSRGPHTYASGISVIPDGDEDNAGAAQSGVLLSPPAAMSPSLARLIPGGRGNPGALEGAPVAPVAG